VVGWGSTYHAIKEAVEEMDRGDVAHMNLQQVYPLHPDVERRIRAAGRTVLIEGNATAQLGRLIRAETGIHITDTFLKYSGMQFSVEEVEAYLRGLLEEVG
jgi:2-oxoglutarate ferredoxin oxidoreductase subunit alpha